jgi:membrane fusion protein (multidrug efflux system)
MNNVRLPDRLFVFRYVAGPLAGIAFLFSCGGKSELDQKKDRLAELRKQSAEMSREIKTLEADLLQLQGSREELKVKSIRVTPLQPSVFRHYVSVQGSLEAQDNLMVSARIPGTIKSIRVRAGDAVSEGQVIAVLDDEVLAKSIEEAETGLAQVNVLFARQKSLWDQKIGTEIQYLTLKNQKEGLEKKLETLRSQVGQSVVKAPFSGFIDEVFAKPGSAASPGVPIASLVNTQTVKAVARVPDSYVAFVKAGDQVSVSLPDLNENILAQVSYVGRIVDPLSRTFKIEIRIPGGNSGLKPNLMALIRINDKTSENALVIAENLVQATELGKVVFVAGEEKGRKVARQRTITTGLSYDGMVEVLSGLQPGDSLITSGYQDLSDLQAIAY